jgi:hypothetical protein
MYLKTNQWLLYVDSIYLPFIRQSLFDHAKQEQSIPAMFRNFFKLIIICLLIFFVL